VGYNLGTWDASAGEFSIEDQGYVAHGEYYAPQAMSTLDGRYVTFGWVTPVREFDDGWADTMMSLPHTLSESDDGSLRICPAAEVKHARDDRYEPITRSELPLTAGSGGPAPLSDLRFDAVEIEATVEPCGATRVTLNLLEHPNGTEVTPVTYDFEAGTLTVDLDSSSAGDGPPGAADRPTTRTVEVPPNEDGSVDLHVFVDRSIVEVFVNGREYVVSRVYPTLEGSQTYSLDVDGDAHLRSLSAYRMGSVWEHLSTRKPDAAGN
jgi:beta-fructofuranosidase